MSTTTIEVGTKVRWTTDVDHVGTVTRLFDLDENLPYAIVNDGVEDHTVAVADLTIDPYLAEYGDWVRLADGRPATVVRAQPCYGNGVPGTYYDLMFKGGQEETLYHWEGDDHLTRRLGFGRGDEAVPFFTVLSQEG